MTEAEKLQAATNDLRVAIREAHETTSDLRQAMKEARELLHDARHGDLAADVEKRIHDQADEMLVAIKDATEKATEAVFKRFQEIHDTLVGLDKASKRQGKASLPAILARASEELES